MKKISLFVVCSLLLQSFAWAGPKDSLKAILDEYRYSVTVEWDQVDKEQFDSYQANFSQQLRKVALEENLTVKDFEEFIQRNSRELNVDPNILEMMKDRNGELNLERAQQVLEESADHIYMQGSSWAPAAEDILLYGILGLLFVELVILAITHKSDVCPNEDYHANDIPYACNY